MLPFRDGLIKYLNGAYAGVLSQIGDAKLSDEVSAKLEQAIADYKNQFIAARAQDGAAAGDGNA